MRTARPRSCAGGCPSPVPRGQPPPADTCRESAAGPGRAGGRGPPAAPAGPGRPPAPGRRTPRSRARAGPSAPAPFGGASRGPRPTRPASGSSPHRLTRDGVRATGRRGGTRDRPGARRARSSRTTPARGPDPARAGSPARGGRRGHTRDSGRGAGDRALASPAGDSDGCSGPVPGSRRPPRRRWTCSDSGRDARPVYGGGW